MPEPMLLFQMAVALAAIGAFAGVMAGLLGVGGGIILVPAFFYAFSALGYTGPDLMQMCLATSLATIVVTSARSVSAHHKKGAVEWVVLKAWAPWIVLGAIVGVFVTGQLRSTQLQLIFGGLAMIVALYLTFGRSDWRLGDAIPKGIKGMVLSAGIGLLSVLMGIGGGSFGVPSMTLFGVPIHRAVATAAGIGAVIALPAVAGFLFMPMESAPPFTFGSINLPAFALIILMTFFTAPIGAALAHRTDAARLKRIFGLFLFLVAANMLRKAAL